MRYLPFDDSQEHVRGLTVTENGYDTRSWDLYRQGIEISTDKFRFLGSQPKLWSGATSGNADIVTYGQNPGTIEADSLGLQSKFEDLPGFNPAAYLLLGQSYPLPIVFNDGPSEEFEATIEPLTIPFKKPTNEGPYYAHGVHGTLEEGNVEGHVVKSSNIVEQFVDMRPGICNRFFLDEGAGYFGNLARDAYVAEESSQTTPFDDSTALSPKKDLTTLNSIFIQLEENSLKIGESTFLAYGKKSAPAGIDCYGGSITKYGTDSIAFNGWFLGS